MEVTAVGFNPQSFNDSPGQLFLIEVINMTRPTTMIGKNIIISSMRRYFWSHVFTAINRWLKND
jgi:hypothetical protein